MFIEIGGIALSALAATIGVSALIDAYNSYDLDSYGDVTEIMEKGTVQGLTEEKILEELGLTRDDVNRILENEAKLGMETTEPKKLLEDIKVLCFDVTKGKIANAVSEATGMPIEKRNITLYLNGRDVNVKVAPVDTYTRSWISTTILGKKSIPKEIEEIVRTIGEIQSAEETEKYSIEDCSKWIKRISKFAGVDIKMDNNQNIISEANPFKEQGEVDYCYTEYPQKANEGDER